MEKSKYYLFFLIALPVLAASSISFFSCPPVKENPINNTIKKTGIFRLSDWSELLEDIYNKGLLVNIDLSECKAPDSGGDVLKRVNEDGSDYTPTNYPAGSGMSGKVNPYNDYIQFNPYLGGSFGKEFILSIILPDDATMISNASDDIEFDTLEKTDILKKADNKEESGNAFRHFTRLKSVTGKNIRLIGTLAFYNCTSLEEVNFPNVNIVMQYAFYNSGIKKAEFEKLRHIMPSTFENCKSLEKAEFHNADIISQRAFKGCENLKEINFSNVKEVEFEAFRNCTSLRIARFLINIWPRTSSNLPVNPSTGTWSEDTVAFHNNVFRGCSSLELLDVRNAWNVYFGEGALADIGTHLELHLYDDKGEGIVAGGRSWGHPQIGMLLGDVPETEEKGGLSLKTLNIIATYVDAFESSRILYADYTSSKPSDNPLISKTPPETYETSSIRNWINSTYNGNDLANRDEFNNPKNPIVKVTVGRRPAL